MSAKLVNWESEKFVERNLVSSLSYINDEGKRDRSLNRYVCFFVYIKIHLVFSPSTSKESAKSPYCKSEKYDEKSEFLTILFAMNVYSYLYIQNSPQEIDFEHFWPVRREPSKTFPRRSILSISDQKSRT